MKVTLPTELEQLVNEKVGRGEFESVDAAVAHAVRQTLGPDGSSHDKEPNEARHISDVFAEIMADVPPDELAKLPKDGASQVDHYVYGLPSGDSEPHLRRWGHAPNRTKNTASVKSHSDTLNSITGFFTSIVPLCMIAVVGLNMCTDASLPPRSAKRVSGSSTRTQEPVLTKEISYQIVASYKIDTGDRYSWKAVVLEGMPTDNELLAVARRLRAIYPSESFKLFSDSTKVQEYINWIRDGQPKPADWFRRHDLGMVNRMLTPQGPRWQLLRGEAYPNESGNVIADLE